MTLFELPGEIIYGEIVKRLSPSEQILFGRTCKWFFNKNNKNLYIRDFVSSIGLFKYALDCDYIISRATGKIAAQYGCVEVLKMVIKKEIHKSSNLIKYAIIGGKLENVKILHKQFGAVPNKWALSIATMYNHLDIIDYLCENGFIFSKYEFNLAAVHCSLETFKAIFKKCPNMADERTYISAVQGENYDILKFLYKNYCSWGYHYNVFIAAATNGNMRIIKYLHKVGCPWNEEVCEVAAYYNNFVVLKYLHKLGCPWNNEKIMIVAINVENLEMVKFLYENGCLPTNNIYKEAVRVDEPNIIDFLGGKIQK